MSIISEVIVTLYCPHGNNTAEILVHVRCKDLVSIGAKTARRMLPGRIDPLGESLLCILHFVKLYAEAANDFIRRITLQKLQESVETTQMKNVNCKITDNKYDAVLQQILLKRLVSLGFKHQEGVWSWWVRGRIVLMMFRL